MCRFMDSGLFALCRHPNYFGEILLWTSLTVLAGTHGVFAKHPWIIASPAFTIFLLLYVSGELYENLDIFLTDLMQMICNVCVPLVLSSLEWNSCSVFWVFFGPMLCCCHRHPHSGEVT